MRKVLNLRKAVKADTILLNKTRNWRICTKAYTKTIDVNSNNSRIDAFKQTINSSGYTDRRVKIGKERNVIE